jgi:hypothetical protein
MGRPESLRRVAAGASFLVASLVLLVLCTRQSGHEELLTTGLWYNSQHEAQTRVPIRSVDSLGGYVPSVTREMRTPGFFERESDDVARYSQPLKLEGEARIKQPAASLQQAAEATTPAAVPAAAPSALQQPGTSVPVHVVDTPEGRMIYYPYVPSPASMPTAQASAQAGQGGAASLSASSVPGGSVVGKVLQETDGSWTAPYGDYNNIQGNVPVQQKQEQELSHVERQLIEYKKRARRRLERVKGKVWRDHKRYLEMRRELDRLRVEVRACFQTQACILMANKRMNFRYYFAEARDTVRSHTCISEVCYIRREKKRERLKQERGERACVH